MRRAEVIGDPIAQSKSPIVHKYWLGRLKLEGDYRRTLVPRGALPGFLDERRNDPDWLGCNVTIPHKEAITHLLDRISPEAKAVGAVNCVVPEAGGLAGYNSDIDGVAAALDASQIRGRKVAIIGAGGAARAMVAYAARHGVGRIAIVARNPGKAQSLQFLAPGVDVSVLRFDQADRAFGGAAAIVNASPLGMAGTLPMPKPLLDAVLRYGGGKTLFDMVTTPAETDFLAGGRTIGARTVDGLAMLIGQAAKAFELFFGQAPPPADAALRALLVTDVCNSD